MIIALKNNLSLLKIAFIGWWSKDPFRESAVIAYYSIFSLPGLLVVSAMLSAFGIWISNHFSDSFLVVLQVVNFIFSFIIILVLYGAEYTHAYAVRNSGKVIPAEIAKNEI